MEYHDRTQYEALLRRATAALTAAAVYASESSYEPELEDLVMLQVEVERLRRDSIALRRRVFPRLS